MSDIDVQVDELANPDYPKRFSSCFKPSRSYDQIDAVISAEGWYWKKGNQQFTVVRKDGKEFHGDVAFGPRGLCDAYIRAKGEENEV